MDKQIEYALVYIGYGRKRHILRTGEKKPVCRNPTGPVLLAQPNRMKINELEATSKRLMKIQKCKRCFRHVLME